MLAELFNLQPPAIPWLVFYEANGRCRVRAFLDALPELRRAKLEGQMLAFSDMGWTARSGFMTQVNVKSKHTVYEIKCHQERVLFVRDREAAIAFEAMTKKNTSWSKKELATVAAALPLIELALAAREQGGQK